MNRRMFGHLAMVSLFAAAAWSSAQPAVANADAESFTRGVIDEGLSILRQGGSSKGAKFHDFINTHTDASKAAMFTLGPYRRNANTSDLAAFTDAYREFQFALYARNLDKYKDKSLKVVGSLDSASGDTVVNTIVVDGDTSPDRALRISFRVAGASGNYKFTDVQIEGAWISQAQLEQFRAILSGNGGNIPDLTRKIEERTQHMND